VNALPIKRIVTPFSSPNEAHQVRCTAPNDEIRRIVRGFSDWELLKYYEIGGRVPRDMLERVERLLHPEPQRFSESECEIMDGMPVVQRYTPDETPAEMESAA
jgi:hypothetical protein